MKERLCRRHIVLLGIGHTNAHIVRMWKMHRPRDTDLVCLSDYSIATYSGMLPAVLAKQVPTEAMQIDLVRFCKSVGATLITDRVTGINHERREVCLANHPPVPFDALSIGVGSTINTGEAELAPETNVLIKPMQSFLPRLRQAIRTVEQSSDATSLRIAIVGGGVAGMEITCCLHSFLQAESDRDWRAIVVSSSEEVLGELRPKTGKVIREVLKQRGVELITGRKVRSSKAGQLKMDDDSTVAADVVIWATGAAAPELLSELGLPLDQRGFLATDSKLQCVPHPGIFAVGDTGSIQGDDVPKAGVYAVRQGPVLWENLQRCLDDRPLKEYQPQRTFLKLINLGNGEAVGQWRKLTYKGRAAMQLKHYIDSRFLDKHEAKPMEETPSGGGDEVEAMQCRGCGCKLGADTLEAAIDSSGDVTLDDAAVIDQSNGRRLLASTDFFTSPLDDAYLVGRIAALHSASDLIASGASVTHALANMVIPDGDAATQQRVLRDMIAGAKREFDQLGTRIVGGHTIVGPRTEIGFTVIGRSIGSRLLEKSQLRVGDRIYLTKPLGIGVLLAAHMRSRCNAKAYEQAIEAMLAPQHHWAKIAAELDLRSGTDVTGFGLAGHLVEMTRASGVDAVVQLRSIPVLPGAIELIEEGIASSLLPENRRFKRWIDTTETIAKSAAFDVLLDPQTCGGLLLGVPEDQSTKLIQLAAIAGLPEPVCIGQVQQGTGRLKIVDE